jgi:hypothetical protein
LLYFKMASAKEWQYSMKIDERLDNIYDKHQGVDLGVSINDVIWLIEQLRMARASLKKMKNWYGSSNDYIDKKYVCEEAERGLGERAGEQ